MPARATPAVEVLRNARREFLDAPRAKYRAELRGRETVAGQALDHVVLTPLRAAPYRSAELWIDPQGAQVRKVVIREENGTVRTITLGAVQANPSLAADVFSFTPPAGAQVITR